MLASQDVAGIEAFWGKPAVFEQCTLRIAMPKARRVLAETNDAAVHLPRWHAVINHDSGIAHGNELARIPDATGQGIRGRGPAPVVRVGGRAARKQPRLFDGGRAPTLDELLAQVTFEARPPVARSSASALNVDGSIAEVADARSAGRNIGVIGDGARRCRGRARPWCRGAGSVSTTAAKPGSCSRRSWPRHSLQPWRSSDGLHQVWARGDDGAPRRLPRGASSSSPPRCRRRGGRATDRSPIYLVLYAGDAADTVLEKTGTDALRTVLRLGPADRCARDRLVAQPAAAQDPPGADRVARRPRLPCIGLDVQARGARHARTRGSRSHVVAPARARA